MDQTGSAATAGASLFEFAQAHLAGETSFARLLERTAADRLPWHRRLVGHSNDIPHGTTVLALTYSDGALLAGDRRATMGNLIAQHDLEKVYQADEFSGVAFAGAVGTALDLIQLYQVELEHYEKIEGVPLTLDGKVTKLSAMVRAMLPMAMQGMAVVPLLAGFDLHRRVGRIFSGDVTGSMNEARHYESVGSGSYSAKSALKKLYRPGLDEAAAARICVEALYDAADDTATGGPDSVRHVYPIVAVVTAHGYRRYADSEVASLAQAMLAERAQSRFDRIPAP